MPRLFHVSDRDDIELFRPRVAPTDPAARSAVWAIDEDHVGNQLLPRDFPRVCVRAGPTTSPVDASRFLFGDLASRVIAIETAWWGRVRSARLWVYELPEESFRLLDETAGYYLADETVTPVDRRAIHDVPAALLAMGYELRVLPSLWRLRDAVIASSLHFSVIRWRNAGPDPRVSP